MRLLCVCRALRRSLAWSLFLAGAALAVGTATGWVPAFGDSWWARVSTILLWLLFADKGYESLVDSAQKAPE